MVAMETMHFFIVQLSLSLRTKILCVSWVPMNDLAPMKNCPGGGCKVGQISSRGISVDSHPLAVVMSRRVQKGSWKLLIKNISK